MKKHIFGILSLLLFASALYFVFLKVPIRKVEPLASLRETENWFGIYFDGKKIGYQMVSRKQIDEETVKLTEKMLLRVSMLGKKVNAVSYGEAEVSPSGALKKFELTISSADMHVEVNGEKVERTLKVTIKTGKDKTSLSIPYREDLLIPMTVLSLMDTIKKEKVTKVPFFDPSTLSTDYITLRFKGYETIEIMGEKKRAAVIEEEFREIRGTMYVDEAGNLLMEKSGLGMETRLESPEKAIKEGWDEGTDIIAISAVPLQNETGISLHQAKRAFIKILNWEGSPPPGFHPAGDGVEGNFELVDPSSLRTTGILGEGMYLEPEPLLQVNAPEIRRKADEITKGIEDTLEKAKKLHEWVYLNLKKEPSFTIPSALDVLKSMRGDCNEHAVLFTALARAAGVPARIAVGLVQQGEYLFYHAWAEIFYKDWIPVDPTLGQFPADLSHIKLGEGGISNWVDAIKGLGKIKVQVLKAE